jgi:hypothetical protein
VTRGSAATPETRTELVEIGVRMFRLDFLRETFDEQGQLLATVCSGATEATAARDALYAHRLGAGLTS